MLAQDTGGAIRTAGREVGHLFLERGEFPKWKMYVQIMPETGKKLGYDPAQLKNPRHSIAAGQKYIARLLRNGLVTPGRPSGDVELF